jgi:hypothetical protein
MVEVYQLSTSKKAITFYPTTHSHISEDSSLNIHSRDHLKSPMEEVYAYGCHVVA